MLVYLETCLQCFCCPFLNTQASLPYFEGPFAEMLYWVVVIFVSLVVKVVR
jgi:hypothetical protein